MNSDRDKHIDYDKEIRDKRKQLRGISFDLFLMNYGKYLSVAALIVVFLPLWLLLETRWWIALAASLVVAGIVHFAVAQHVRKVTQKVLSKNFSLVD